MKKEQKQVQRHLLKWKLHRHPSMNRFIWKRTDHFSLRLWTRKQRQFYLWDRLIICDGIPSRIIKVSWREGRHGNLPILITNITTTAHLKHLLYIFTLLSALLALLHATPLVISSYHAFLQGHYPNPRIRCNIF